jgi:hypothetical protein
MCSSIGPSALMKRERLLWNTSVSSCSASSSRMGIAGTPVGSGVLMLKTAVVAAICCASTHQAGLREAACLSRTLY